MSSFNIEKFEYIDTQEYPVSLLSYIVSSLEDSKYIIFKFNNNLNQELKQIKYEVSCFDKDNCLVEKIVFANTMSKQIKANTEFICEEKLKVSNSVNTIKVNLIEADFDRSIFRNGKLNKINNPIKLENTKKVKEKKVKVQKNKSHNSFKFKSVYKIKRPKLLNFILVFILLVCIAGIVGNLYLYKNKYGKRIKLDGITYEIKSETCYVSDIYDDSSKILILPKEISYKDSGEEKKYMVSGISEGAFLNSKITQITFNSNIVLMKNAFKNSNIMKIYNSDYITSIGESAFENCQYLTEFSSANCTYIAKKAFKNCNLLYNVNVKNASVANRAFENTSLQQLCIGSPYNKLRDLFKDSNEVISINSVMINKASSSIDISYMSIYYLYIPYNTVITGDKGNYSNINFF